MDRTEIGFLLAGLLLAASVLVLPPWLTFLLTLALARALVVQGLLIQMRGGLVSFGQGLYFGLGGYAIGYGSHLTGIHDGIILTLLGVALSGLVAAVLGLLLARYRGIFFAMLSLAFSMILYGVLVKSPDLGSTDGFNVTGITLLGWHPDAPALRPVLYVITCLIAAGIGIFVHRYTRSPLGAVTEAIRENEVRVDYLGVSPQRVLYVNYVTAAMISALGGALVGLATGHVDPEMTYWTTSGEFVFIALLGGTGHAAAPFIAAVLFSVVRTYALELMPNTWQMILGIVLLLVILFLPRGLWSLFERRQAREAA